MRIGIRFQLTSVSIVVILFTAIVLTATSTVILRRTLSSQLNERTSQVAPVLQGQLAARTRELEHNADLWTSNEQLQKNVHYEDWADAAKTIDELKKNRTSGFVLLFDESGAIQAVVGLDADKAAPFGAARIRTQLQRGRPVSMIEPVGSTVYIIAAQKFEYYGREEGEIMVVQPFNDGIATEIQQKIGAQVTVFTAQGPTASSIKPSPSYATALTSSWKQLNGGKLAMLGTVGVGDTNYLAMAFAPSATTTGKTDTAPIVGVAYAIPETEMAQAQRRTVLGSLGLLVVISIIGVVLGLTLANTIARPITAMAEQFSRISASGDLSLRVEETQTNEIGDMARSFNAMQQRVEQLHGRVVQAEERMRKELQMASTVQEMLFQQAMPHNRSCDVAAYTSTLVETSGDWYAVFDDPDAKRTIFVIADATGHGASAALLTAITHGFFQTMWTARQGTESALARIAPSQILSMLNSVVLNSAHGTITATVFVGVLHHGTRKMVYASAGHIPPIVTRWVNNEMKANILTCNPSSSIGSSDKPIYEDYTVELPADSIVLIYTDGLTEVENPAGLQWGVRKLIAVLRTCQSDTVEAVRQKVLDSVLGFARGKELQDDLTYLTVRVL
jgi:serine phosphatase RsbU (regulator of sigma subunit)